MDRDDTEKIRHAVRNKYGRIAKTGSDGKGPAPSCCGSPGESLGNGPSPCCGNAPVSIEKLSAAIGYNDEDIGSVPDGANMGLGCGNPVAMASLRPGETVVDLGSGGGIDCFIAAKKVGKTGWVIGVDMTPDMVGKARNNARTVGADNVEFRLGEIEHLPVADSSADVILSNCVVNLSPEKSRVFRDAFRVLKPGGRLIISDILATRPLPERIRNDLELVSACIGGAATIDETERLLEGAGFREIRIESKFDSNAVVEACAPGAGIGDYVVSALIEATKPKRSVVEPK